jgi:hypothetical protein
LIYKRVEDFHISSCFDGCRRTGKDFPKYGAPVSVLSGRKWWPLPAHGYHVVTFLTKSASNFVAISSLVLELLKKCRIRQQVGQIQTEIKPIR